MKTKLLTSWAIALGIAIMATTPRAVAQSAVVRTTTTSTGAIEQFAPDSELVLRTETASAPIRYSITRETRFVDDAGAPVTVEKITRGLPVNVEYVREGDRMIVSRVIVRRAAPVVEQRTTTTTTTERALTHEEKERLEKARKIEEKHAKKVREADEERDKDLREEKD